MRTADIDNPELNADLLGTEASRIAGDWPGRGYRGVTSEASSPTAIFYQAWEVPADFVITGLRVQIGSRFWTVAVAPPPLGPHIAEDARIVVRVASDTGGVLACLQRGGMEPVCPESGEAVPDAGGADGWSWSSMLRWIADVPAEALVAVGAPLPSCSIVEKLGELAWQMTALGDNGTAVYVGRDQFITSERLFSDATPWGVASRGEVSLPVIRVASDTRNGLVLVEVIGGRTPTGRRDPAPFAAATADYESSAPVLVAYPWGDADRFALTRLRVSEVSERLIRHNGWGWDRAGAPLVDPCTGEVIGLSTGRSEALRAETVKAVLAELRARRAMPVISNRGPSLHGSIALLPHPVYLGTEQPDFGGWICNVRASTRYEVIYAVYLVSDSSPHITGVVDGKRAWFSRCGWTDKIFILEYRSDETPNAVCAAPWEPRSPLSTLALELFAPSGAELLQATELERLPCPGMPSDRKWASTHFVRMRFTDTSDVDDLVVWLEDETGKRFHSVGSSADVDPDVRAWRYDLEDAEPVRLVVTTRENADSWEAPETLETDVEEQEEEEEEEECVEDPGPNGEGMISATLHESQTSFGNVKLVTFAEPWRCPWRHTHGLLVTLAEPLSAGQPSASLLSADGRVLLGDWPGRSYRGVTDAIGSPTAKFTQRWEVPEDFVPVAFEVEIGNRRWVAQIEPQAGG